MGTKNRQRRLEKQRRKAKARGRGRAQSRGPAPGDRGGEGTGGLFGDDPEAYDFEAFDDLYDGGDDEDGPPFGFDLSDTRSALHSAAAAFGRGDKLMYGALLACLAEVWSSPDNRRLAAPVIDECLGDEIRRAWSRGWQPADVVRVAGRDLGPVHARYTSDVIAADTPRYAGSDVDPRWSAQLRDLGADIWWRRGAPHLEPWAAREGLPAAAALAVAVEALSLLVHLPVLPRLCAPPGEPGHGGQARRRLAQQGHSGPMLARVRALLAKAESTTFGPEAEALTAKAQELMARHAIDEAMVDGGAAGGAGAGGGAEPAGVRLAVDDPYASAKSLLLSVVASANNCRAVWSKHFGFSTVFGFDTDLEFVEICTRRSWCRRRRR